MGHPKRNPNLGLSLLNPHPPPPPPPSSLILLTISYKTFGNQPYFFLIKTTQLPPPIKFLYNFFKPHHPSEPLYHPKSLQVETNCYMGRDSCEGMCFLSYFPCITHCLYQSKTPGGIHKTHGIENAWVIISNKES